MFEHSEQPSPSIRSIPVACRSRSATEGGRLSPEETASRTGARAPASGWRSRNRASCDQKVGTAVSTVTPWRSTVPRTERGVGRVPAERTAVAPLPRTRKKPLPKPSEVNSRAIEWQRSPGVRASTSRA